MSPPRLYSSLSVVGVLLTSCIVLGAGCPYSNVTDQQLLRENRHLRELYNMFSVKHGGKINLDGLKNLITKLYIITTCPGSGRSRNFLGRNHPRDRHIYDDYYRQDDQRRNYGDVGPYGDYYSQYRESSGRYRDNNNYRYGDRSDRYNDHNRRYPDRPPYDSRHLHDSAQDHPHNDDADKRKGTPPTKKEFEQADEPFTPKEDEKFHPKGEEYDKRNRGEQYPNSKGEKYDPGLDKNNPHYRRQGPYQRGGKGSYMTEDCETIESVILNSGIVKEDVPLGPHDLLYLCPSIVKAVLNPPCDAVRKNLRMMVSRNTEHGYDERSHNHHHRHWEDYDYEYHMTRDAWIGAILSLVLIGLIALMCILVIPVLKKSKYYTSINHFLLALAVGSLAGDALIHLLPHALTMELSMNINAHLAHALYGFTAFMGIMVFLLMERVHNLLGHKHSHGLPTTAATTMNTSSEKDEMSKELGVISTSELNETNPKHAAKIGKKLSQHSKTSSFTHMEASADSRGCFDSCPTNRSSTGVEDANGNSGMDSIRKPRLPERHSSTAERERLVAVNQELLEKVSSTPKGIKPNPIPPPPLIQNSSPKPLVRQDSKNFNMVLQEYHIGHHGHSHHGHSHVTGKKDSLRTMILLGDGIHTFIDGMAIGAAYGTSLTGGIATAIAVLCHELPHKVGDFAILFEMGMKRNQAIKMVFILWLLSFCGLAVGVSLGSIQAVSPWIYCFTAGIFLYLALVDLLSELSIKEDGSCSAAGQMLLQIGGMFTGALIMLVIAIYEHDLESLLEGSFDSRDMRDRDRRYYNREYNYNYDYTRP